MKQSLIIVFAILVNLALLFWLASYGIRKANENAVLKYDLEQRDIQLKKAIEAISLRSKALKAKDSIIGVTRKIDSLKLAISEKQTLAYKTAYIRANSKKAPQLTDVQIDSALKQLFP